MSSKRHMRRRACENKKRYESVEDASHASRKMRRAFEGGTWAAYRCPFCGGWHVGRRDRRSSDNAERRRAGEF